MRSLFEGLLQPYGERDHPLSRACACRAAAEVRRGGSIGAIYGQLEKEHLKSETDEQKHLLLLFAGLQGQERSRVTTFEQDHRQLVWSAGRRIFAPPSNPKLVLLSAARSEATESTVEWRSEDDLVGEGCGEGCEELFRLIYQPIVVG